MTDTYNDRVVRRDDMNGANWTSFGTYGVGQFAFRRASVSILRGTSGWDNSNGRLIRMADMNCTSFAAATMKQGQ
jgi:hypothetical protein